MNEDLSSLKCRIKELNDKASQLLLFLSFAIVAAVLLETSNKSLTSCQLAAVKWGLRFWVCSLFPILVSVMPIKELGFAEEAWYGRIWKFKFWLLVIAILMVIIGTIGFLIAVWSGVRR